MEINEAGIKPYNINMFSRLPKKDNSSESEPKQ